jgi:hypothetical protein
MGSLFKAHVVPLMIQSDSGKQVLQKLAVQFAALWLPITHENAAVEASQILMDGMKRLPKSTATKGDEGACKAKVNQEKARAGSRARILWQLLQMPGMTLRLSCVPSAPRGWFGTPNHTAKAVPVGAGNMPLTSGLALFLSEEAFSEIQATSSRKTHKPPTESDIVIYITRPLPPIPGVPSGTTTVPPVFMDPSWVAKFNQVAPDGPSEGKSYYEQMERSGRVPCVPPGYTYSPSPIPSNKDEVPPGKVSLAPRPPDPRTISNRKKIPFGCLPRPNHADTITAGGQDAPGALPVARPPQLYDHGDGIDEKSLARGSTYDRRPIIFQNAPKGQTTALGTNIFPETEFLMNAPVVIDIVCPDSARRIAARVVAINKCFEPVTVSNQGCFSPGARFNLHVRRRLSQLQQPSELVKDPQAQGAQTNAHALPLEVNTQVNEIVSVEPNLGVGLVKDISEKSYPAEASENSISEWMTVQLQVEDDPIEYFDVLRSGSSAPPVAAGLTQDGYPYYAPVANMAPLPIGYTGNGEAYFPINNPPLKPIPAGVTSTGIKYYHNSKVEGSNASAAASALAISWDTTSQFVNQFAGFDYFGEPIFIPKGCKVPHPAGFTYEGIPYYDLTSILLERGVLVEVLDPMKGFTLPLECWTDVIKLIQEQTGESGFNSGQIIPSISPDIPTGVQFIRDLDDLSHLRPPGIKTILEPSSLTFQSVTGVVTKNCVLKFRALRGDHTERDYFFTVDPPDSFSVDVFHVRLQGEGMVQVKVSCFPSRIKFNQTEGTLAVIDDTGRRLSTCRLSAIKKSFVQVSPLNLHFGWVLPMNETSLSISVENISSSMIAVQIKPPTNGFVMKDDGIKLQSKEMKSLVITFSPNLVGAYESHILLEAPGGEAITVHLVGVCGVPIAIHPESNADSQLGPHVLARERSSFFSRVFKLLEKESVLAVAESHLKSLQEQKLFSSILAAMDPVGRRDNNLCLDFGVVESKSIENNEISAVMCLTLFNVSTEPLTCHLHSNSPCIAVEGLVRIASHKANSVNVFLTVSHPGEFRALLTIVCPGFTSIPCLVKAFVGCPVEFVLEQTVWMPAAPAGSASKMTVPIMNFCDYEVPAFVSIQSDSDKFKVAVPLKQEHMADTDDLNNSKPTSALQDANFGKMQKRRPLLPIQNESSRVRTRVNFASRTILFVDIICEPVGHIIEIAKIHIMLDSSSSMVSPTCTFMCMPLWSGLGKQDLESLTHWLEQANAIFPQVPHLSLPPLLDSYNREAPEPENTLQFRVNHPKLVSPDNVVLQNPSSSPAVCHILLTPGYEILKQNINVIRVESRESAQLNLSFRTDMFLENHGFIVAYPEKSLPIIEQVVSCPLLCVFPIPNANREVRLDFGTIESGSPKTSPWCNINILIANTRSDANVLWTCRVMQSRGRHIPFEVINSAGNLRALSVDAVHFCALPTVQGSFEAVCELSAKDGPNAAPIPICNIVLTAHVVISEVVGLPDSYDFGSCVVGSIESFTFKMENIGSAHANVAFITRNPFEFSPALFSLPIGGQQAVKITFSPTESSKDSIHKVSCFINHQVYTMRVIGKSGFVELVSNNHHNMLDFGSVSSTCIAWMNLFVTNRGTLTLKLDCVSAQRPEFLTLELVRKQLIVKQTALKIRRDGWSIVKSKLKALALIGHFLRLRAKTFKLKGNPDKKDHRDDDEDKNSVSNNKVFNMRLSTKIPIGKDNQVNLSELVDPHLLELEPMHSYMFRLGFSTTHQTMQTTDLTFYYSPMVSNNSRIHNKKLKFTVTGYIYRVLDFFPRSMDFGLVPVTFSANSLKHVLAGKNPSELADHFENQSLDFSTQYVRISNMSIETQSISLLLSTTMGGKSNTQSNENGDEDSAPDKEEEGNRGSLLSAFRLDGRNWTLGPGDSVKIPVRFVPLKPQTQYRGDAVFQHSHGITILHFIGTGASAEILHGNSVHFGAVLMNKTGYASLTVYNKGLLSSEVRFQMMDADVFRFDSNDPFDFEGTIEPGSTMDIKLTCFCSQQVPSVKSCMRAYWRRCIFEPWEVSDVALSVDVGYPRFSLDHLELDFGVTYIKKSLSFCMSNEGNASCSWKIVSNDDLEFSKTQGVLLPLSSETIEISFQPRSFETLESNIVFVTDAGTKTVLAYGIVGVPYLHIPTEYNIVDFGIVEIQETHQQQMMFFNTGPKQIEFTITVQQAHDVFDISPSHGFISPKSSMEIIIKAVPQEFSVVSNCAWEVVTTDGERYEGSVACIGGQAIIVMSKLFDDDGGAGLGTEVQGASMPGTAEGDKAKLTEKRFSYQASIAMEEHLVSLKRIVAYLSSDEAKELETQVRASEELRKLKSRSASRPGTRQDASSREKSADGALFKSLKTPPFAGKASPPVLSRESKGSLSGEFLPTLSKSSVSSSLPGSRPSTQSSAKLRWMEGTLFNVHDIQQPVVNLLSKAEGLSKRLQVSSPLQGGGVSMSLPVHIEGDSEEDLQSIGRFGGDSKSKKFVTPQEVQKHVEESKRTLEALQQHMSHVTESKYANLLQEASDILLHTTRRLEQILYPEDTRGSRVTSAPSKEDTAKNVQKTFDLGLRRGNTVVSNESLFDMPNLGNLPFSFSIVLEPPSMSKFFDVRPPQYIVSPGSSTPITVTFTATESGTYRVECQVICKDHIVLVFAITATVGNPKIEVESKDIDCGCLLIGTTSKTTMTISNVGTYRDTVEVNLISDIFEVHGPNNSIILNPGCNTLVTLVFKPIHEGEFSCRFVISPAICQPIEATLKGKGGCPHFELNRKKLDFGRIFTGTEKSLSFQVSNTGTWKASMMFRLNHPCFSASTKNGKVNIAVPQEIEVNSCVEYFITFSSEEKTEAAFRFFVEELIMHQKQEVQIYGFAGMFDFAVQGSIEYSNLKVEELQGCQLTLVNAGDFPAIVRYSLQPDLIKDIFTIITEEEPHSGPLEVPPQSEHLLVVNTCPKVASLITGTFNLVAKAALENDFREEEFNYPFSYLAFDQPVVADRYELDTNVGVLAIGKSAEWNCGVTNFDSRNAIIKLKIHPINTTVEKPQVDLEKDSSKVKSKSKSKDKEKEKPKEKPKKGTKKKDSKKKDAKVAPKPSCWTLPLDEGFLSTTETQNFRAIFTATDDPEASHEAYIVVEYSLDGGITFEHLQKYHVMGKSGMPELALSSPILDFGFAACGTLTSLSLTLENKGTAASDWNVIEDLEHLDTFKFLGLEYNGTLEAGNSVGLQFQFQPSVEGKCASKFKITSDFQELNVDLRGEGCVHRLYIPSIPELLSLQGEINGSAVFASFQILNDCVFDIPIKFQFSCKNGESYNTYLHPKPLEFVLQRNNTSVPTAADRNSFNIQVQFDPVQTNSSTEISTLLKEGLRYVLEIFSETLQDNISIPVQVSFSSKYLGVSPLEIDFGNIAYDESKKTLIEIVNPNPFPVPITMIANHPQVKITGPQLLPPSGVSRAEIQVLPKEYQNEEDIPRLLTIQEYAFLTNDVFRQDVQISVTCQFFDIQEPPVFKDIDFGTTFVSIGVDKEFGVQNWGRKALEYQLSIEQGDQGVFVVNPPENASGSISPRGFLRLPITFLPNSVASIAMPISFVTSMGSYTFNLFGKGIEPELEFSEVKLDFGQVGLGFAAKKTLNICNLTPLEVQVDLYVSSAGDDSSDTCFEVVPGVYLNPLSKCEIEVTFRPTARDAETGFDAYNAAIFALALGKQRAQCELEGTPGRLELMCQTPLEISFPDLEKMEMSSVSIIFENTGNVPTTLAFSDSDMRYIENGKELSGKVRPFNSFLS